MKLLRLFVAVVFKVFYITVLNYLLGPANCSWLVNSKVHNNVDFPAKSTLGLGHAAAAAGDVPAATRGVGEAGDRHHLQPLHDAVLNYPRKDRLAWERAHTALSAAKYRIAGRPALSTQPALPLTGESPLLLYAALLLTWQTAWPCPT
jgi:hypothetical protein